MGRTRHSKNAGGMGAEGLRYHERRQLGFGTVRARLGKDSHGDFHDCRLTNAPAVDPVVTPDGHLFGREAILEYILERKRELRKELEAWEAQEAGRERERQAAAERARRAALETFDREQNLAIAGGGQAGPEGPSLKTAYWLPSQAPEAAGFVKKPKMDVLCPNSGKKLRMKDLVAVKFTRLPGGPEGRFAYMDPVTKQTLTNKDSLVVLKPTGDVMRLETYRKVVKPDGAYGGKKVREKDVIALVKLTGFAGNDKDKASAGAHFSVGLDQRHHGGGSKFGLTQGL